MEDKIIFKELQINQEIRDKEVRLISETGEQLGIVSGYTAQTLADEKGLDLVKISPSTVPPVCKILDYGKYRFEAIKKEKDARKNQKIVELKEVRLSMTIDVHDFEVKVANARKFLAAGDKCKVTIRMRGRQNIRSEMGVEVMNKFYETVKDICVLEKKPLTEGKNIIMILGPIKA